MPADAPFTTSAEATQEIETVRAGEFATPITNRRSAEIVASIKSLVDRARADDSDASPPQRHGYGLTKVETLRVFREIDAQGRLHVVDVIAGEQVDGVLAYEIEAEDVSFVYPGNFPGQIRPDGEIFSGRFEDNGTLIRFFDGTQTASDPDLVASTSWASTGVGAGIAYVYSRWTFIPGRFSGDPEINVYARMGRATDPRDVQFNTIGGAVEPLVAWQSFPVISPTSFPIPDGSDRLLAVALTLEDGSFPTIDGCTFGDQSLEFLEPPIFEPVDGFNKSAVLFLREAQIAQATGDVLDALFSSLPTRATSLAAVYQNVDQDDPFVDFGSTTNDNGNAPPVTLNTAENGYVFGHFMSGRTSDISWLNGHVPVAEFDTGSTTAGIGELPSDGNPQTVRGLANSVDRSLMQAVALRPNLAVTTNAGAFTYDSLPKGFTVNPYRHVWDLLIKPKALGGFGVSIDRINVDNFQFNATWAEGALDVPVVTKDVRFTADSNKNLGTPPANTNHVLELDEAISSFAYGDIVQVSGQIPSSLTPGRDYHVIPVRPAVNDFQLPAIALADTFADALAGNSIALGTVTTSYKVSKVREIRFTSGFSYLSTLLAETLTEALASCGASLFIQDGKLSITRQTFPDTVEIVTEDDLLGAVALSNRLPRQDRATEVVGGYTSVLNLFQVKDYPVRDGGGVFEAADGGERRSRRLNLPFIGKSGPAQRVATVALRRIRQERVLSFSGGLSLFKLEPGTVFSLIKPSLGLDEATTFEVRDKTLFVEIQRDKPFVGIDIIARQLEAETFDLSLSDQDVVESAKIIGLQSPFQVPPPGRAVVSEELFTTKNGAGVRAKAIVEWSPSSGAFVQFYRLGFKLSTASAFTFVAPTPDTSIDILDLAPGDYDFQVEAINSIGAFSAPVLTSGVTISGLAAPPVAPQNFFGQVVGSDSVLLQWDRSTELDVTEGGLVEIRHDTDPAGGNGVNAVLIATDVGGKAITQTAFKQGVFYARFQDTSGQWSDFAEWSTEGRRPVPFGQFISSGAFLANDTIEDQVTIQEDSTFPSTNVGNTLVFVTDHLELPPKTNWDDVVDVDAVLNVDDIGADGEFQPEGVYFFSTGIDLNDVTRVRLEAVIKIEIVDAANSIDNITDIDAIANIDAIGSGAAQAGLATAWIEVRMSRDPAASNTFGQWQRLDTGVFNQRSYEFRVQARSLSPTVNVRVTQARIIARELPVNA